jgi:hypothetical protein
VRSSVILFVLILASVGLAQAPPSAQKPLDKDQVMTLVTAGMDNAQLAKKIEELGIDFEPTDEYLQALRKAGAQDVLIQALRAVKPEPLTRQQVLQLVAGGVPSQRATALVKQRGIDFVADEKYVETLRVAGADEALIAAVREASAAIPGGLMVATSPNAEVYLDGALMGRADSGGELEVKKVKPGAHALRVTLPTKRDFEQIITVAAGVANKIAAPLTDLPGKIVVGSTAGVEVYLDGASRGKIDASGKLALTDVPPGSHQLRVTAQGKKDYEQSVSVSAGQETEIQARLEDLPGTIRVRATPGAKVFLDDKWPLVVHADGQVVFADVPAGLHPMRIVAQGQPEFRREVTVAPGREASLEAPRADAPKPSTGKRIEGLYRDEKENYGFWEYFRFFTDGTVIGFQSRQSPADAERDFQAQKARGEGFPYQIQGSTIRFSTGGWGAVDYVGKVHGDTLTLDWAHSDGRHGQDTYRLVSSGPAPIRERRK